MLERTRSAPRKAEGGHAVSRLAERRRLRRRRGIIAFLILVVLLIGGLLWGLWQSEVRISQVDIIGLDSEPSLLSSATNAMQGAYFGIVPRDSIFFFPEARIRSDILSKHSDMAAVSIVRKGFTGISIRADYRVAVGRWCGLAPTEGVDEYCYFFDANGLIFAAVSTSTQPINTFALYDSPVGDVLEPLRATLADADKLPAAFDFARQLATLGSLVEKVIIRGGEVDDILASGTRVTYVLGREQDAFTALVSAGESLDLSSGAVNYVDLRFDGKVYVKKK